MGVAMAVSISISVVVVMMVPTRGPHAKQVDHQSDNRDKEELVGIHFRRVDDALDRLEDDEDGDEDEEATFSAVSNHSQWKFGDVLPFAKPLSVSTRE
jgi:hypothetical protein